MRKGLKVTGRPEQINTVLTRESWHLPVGVGLGGTSGSIRPFGWNLGKARDRREGHSRCREWLKGVFVGAGGSQKGMGQGWLAEEQGSGKR